MRNLKSFNVTELYTKELHSVYGGGFFRDLGRAFGKAWCSVKNAIRNMPERKKPPGMTWNEFNGKF